MKVKKAKWLQPLLAWRRSRFLRGQSWFLIFLAVILVASATLNGLLKPAVGQSQGVPASIADASLAQSQQKPTSTPTGNSQELLQQLGQCIIGTIANPQQAALETLQAASMQCVFKVVLLAPDGSIRPDASDRLTALVRDSGVSIPQPTSQGQASVQLKPLADSQVFTIPVTIGGKPKTFLLDTGASSSIVDKITAQQLSLPSTPIPDELLAYMVVGDNCAGISATLHPLPALAVNSAKVQGLNGMGLPQTAIPGKLSGVLGLDFLSTFDVILNPKTFALQLLPPSPAVKGAIPLVGKLGSMTAQVRINGQGPFTFLLDTGADINVVSKRLEQRFTLNAKTEEIKVQGFCGAETGKPIKLAQMSLQQHRATQLDAVIINSDVLNLLGVDGIVGQNFLNRYHQHWRFGKRDALGLAEEGSLVLTPLQKYSE